MKIILKENMAINGKHLKAGDKAEVSDADGNYLVNGGRASTEKKEKKVSK